MGIWAPVHNFRLDEEPRMRDSDRTEKDQLRARAEAGDRDAVDELVELAGENGDLDELRRLAATGSSDAQDVLAELATEHEDLDELQRLADAGSPDARDVLAELTQKCADYGVHPDGQQCEQRGASVA